MARKPKPAPKGSDAEKAGQLEGAASLLPHQLDGAAEQRENTREANERPTEPEELKLAEPGNVAELTGGASALPQSLEPAAENARKAETASELQAELAARPENPNDVYRDHLRKIVKYAEQKHGKETVARSLGDMFGTSEVDKVGVHNLPIAIDEMHKLADKPKE